ncbi:WYL domain-containing protein [Paenibacillus sp. P22]|uniref:helix-turn-helix transcriptional regulator n=1 Tax=Paenibacillus sp. P22 TaxID=483908 RepID=UPI002FC29D0E
MTTRATENPVPSLVQALVQAAGNSIRTESSIGKGLGIRWASAGFGGELRSFRADRIRSVESSSLRFEKPEGFSAKEYLLSSLMPGALEKEPLVDVVLEGAPLALGELCRHWLFGHSVAERLPERLHLRLGGDSLQTFVPYFLLPYGRSLTIIEPASLIERMVQVSSEAAAHYTDMLKRHSISTKGRLKP